MMKKLLLLFTLICLSNTSFGQVALTQNFDGTTFPPTGWTVENTHATNRWARTTAALNGAGSASVTWIAAPQDEGLISPSFSLAGYTTAYFNYTVSVGYQYMVTIPAGDLTAEISIDGGFSWITLWVEEDEGVYADYAPIYKHLDISAYVGQTNVMVKFHYVGNDADTAKIDDVSVSSCPTAGDFALTALGDTTAAISWAGTSATFDFEWGNVGFTQGTGTLSNQATTTFNFSGLTPGSGYSYYVKANCGGTNGGWQGPFNFYTNLYSPTNLDYSFGFETPTLGSGGWTTSEAATGGAWDRFAASGALVQDGTALAGCFGTTVATNAWLYSRGMNLTAGTTITIKYYIRKYNAVGTTSSNSVKVKIGMAATPAGQTATIATHTAYAALTYTLQTFTYLVPTTGVYYLGFNCTSAAQTSTQTGAILLDAVSVTTPLAVNAFISDKFSVSPNPATDVINISNAENILVTGVSLTDLNGRMVKSAKFDNLSNVQINISDLSSGVYMMNITSKEGNAIKKIIKN